MTDPTSKSEDKAAREARLAEALRANLRRRKDQQRARRYREAEEAAAPDAETGDGGNRPAAASDKGPTGAETAPKAGPGRA
jgi:hypothetical protein